MDLLKSHSNRGLNEAAQALQIVNLSSDIPARLESASSPLSCKFVVISNGDRRWMLFGAVGEYPYHANLVERFCTTEQIGFQWRPDRDRVDFADTSYAVSGGGFLEINPQTKSLRFTGSSKAYGSIEMGSLRQMLKGQSILKGYKVRVTL